MMWRKLSVVVVVLFLGCLNPFAPRLDNSDVDSGLVITEQRTPDQVLQNFRYAYTFKDSILYADLLDSSFVFVYFDPNQGSAGRFVSWGRDLDLKTTGRLFRNFDVIDLTWNTSIYESIRERTAEVSRTFDLTLVGINLDLRATGTAIFSMRKDERDERWRITRWKDESEF